MKTFQVQYTVVVEVDDETEIRDTARESLDNTGWEPTSVVLLEDDDGSDAI